MKVQIRAAQATDASVLAGFARRTFHDTFAAQNTPQDMETYLSAAFTVERQLDEIADPNTVTLLAEHSAALIGYAQLHLRTPPTCVPDAHAIELVRFYVDRDWHGRGIALELMHAVKQIARVRGLSMWLGVWERNFRAIAFYQKCGFVDVGSHDFQLGSDRQTDRIMWRKADAD